MSKQFRRPFKFRCWYADRFLIQKPTALLADDPIGRSYRSRWTPAPDLEWSLSLSSWGTTEGKKHVRANHEDKRTAQDEKWICEKDAKGTFFRDDFVALLQIVYERNWLEETAYS